jgi:hypothetical protein
VELPRQLAVRRVILGNHHHAAGALVQTMHDARPDLAADAAQVFDVVQQRVHQRAVRVAGGGMHHQACGLVHHHHILIIEQDVERNILGLGPGRRRVWDGDENLVTAAQLNVGLGDLDARHRDLSLVNQPLNLRTGIVGDLAGEITVETLAFGIGRDGKGQLCHAGIRRTGACADHV